MALDIRQKVHDFQKKNLPGRKNRNQSGYTISLGESEHRVARYTKDKDRVSLQEILSVGTEELQKISRGAKSLVVCFSPRSIYADLGDFSSVTAQATRAHIRSTIDKTGLFNEQYDLSFKKIYDIDGVRAKYSYLAIPESEIGKISILNEHEVFIDTYCPIEASIAAMVGQISGDMSLALFEDEQYMRIIGTKAGTIYHIITFHKQRSFDLLAETIAGINEMTSLMRNTYNEPPRSIYKLGNGEVSAKELQENDIEVLNFEAGGPGPDALLSVELLGNAWCSDYNFLPRTYRETKALAGFAHYSMGISLALAVLAVLFVFLGLRNSSEADAYDQKTEKLQQEYARDMSALEKDYASLLKELDLPHINELISLYQDFQSEPKLPAILGTITQAVPNDMKLKRIEIMRSGLLPDPSGGVSVQDMQKQMPTTSNPAFSVKIDGVITAQYPQSKILFSTFLSGIQEYYPVLGASFQHTEDRASYSVACEAKK